VVNTTDANARAGTPSAGLMQFTDPTFARYAMPGYSEWMNPVDQVVADAWDRGYIESAYGSIDNVPGVAAVRQGRQYVGYDSGGWLTPSDTPVNKTGQPEAVLTPQESAAFVAVVKQMLSRQGSAGAAGERTPAVVNFYGPQMPGQEQMAEIMRQVSLAAGG
jgi:SLT domain-containing protein